MNKEPYPFPTKWTFGIQIFRLKADNSLMVPDPCRLILSPDQEMPINALTPFSPQYRDDQTSQYHPLTLRYPRTKVEDLLKSFNAQRPPINPPDNRNRNTDELRKIIFHLARLFIDSKPDSGIGLRIHVACAPTSVAEPTDDVKYIYRLESFEAIRDGAGIDTSIPPDCSLDRQYIEEDRSVALLLRRRDVLSDQIRAKKERIDRVKQAISQLDAKKRYDSYIKTFIFEPDDAKQKEEKERELAALANELTELQSDSQSIREKLNRLKNPSELQAKSDDQELLKLLKENEILSAKNESLEAENTRLKSEKSRMVVESEIQKQKIKTALPPDQIDRHDVESLQETIQEHEITIAHQKKQIEVLQHELATFKQHSSGHKD